MKHVRLALFSIVFAILWPSLVQACSCGPFTERSQIGGIIVSGVIEADIENGIASPWKQYSSRLIAEKVWSGPDQREFRLISPPGLFSTCGSDFVGQPGERVIAWLSRFGDSFYSVHGMCGVLRWNHKDRAVVEANLRQTLTAYDDVDRRIRARPDDPQHWRWRLKIATGLKDEYGRLRSLQRLIGLAPAPDVTMLKDAAAAANTVGEDDTAIRYVAQAQILAPGDDELKKILERIARRRTYDRTIMPSVSRSSWKILEDIIWTGQRDNDAHIDGFRILRFQIERSTFGGLISGSEFHKGIVRETSLAGIVIRNTKLEGVLMRNVTLRDALLSKVDIMGTRIIDTTFRETRLNEVRLLGDLDRVDFGGALLIRVDLAGEELNGVDFSGALLEQVKFHRGRATNVNFTGARLESAEFSPNVVMQRANFSGARISSMEARGVDFREARFTNATIEGCDLAFANLRGADFNGATWTMRNVSDTPLRGAEYDARTKWPATFTDYAGKSYPFDPVALGAILVND